MTYGSFLSIGPIWAILGQFWPYIISHIYMITTPPTRFKELPIDQIELDNNQPRKLLSETDSHKDREKLNNSIKSFGLQEPLMVMEVDENRYLIIDGHRRYLSLKELGIPTVICQIYPKLDDGELHLRRYERQNNRRAWKPQEKSNALNSIKSTLRIKTNEELAKLLNISRTAVANSLQLRDQKLEYLGMMESYKLPESYRLEFVRLLPKLRKIRTFEVPQILEIIFQKVSNKVIRSAKDFRKVGKVFLRAAANEQEIFSFLSNPDATVNELDIKTVQSGFSLHIEQLIREIVNKKKGGLAFSAKEQEQLQELKKVI
jgi:ParB/RepB/Spo0J family partition protein